MRYLLSLLLAGCASLAPSPADSPSVSLDASTIAPQVIDQPVTQSHDDHDHKPLEIARKVKPGVRALPGLAAPITTPKDTVPDFAGEPTITSVRNGEWRHRSTWKEGRAPVSGDVVRIAAGTHVTYGGAQVVDLKAIGVEGRLRISSLVATQMKACTILVYRGGAFQIGERVNPARAGAEVIIRDCPQSFAEDRLQFGTGIISFGEVTMHGRPTTGWLRLASEPKAGDTVLQLAGDPNGWRAGDKLVLPDTQQVPLTTLAPTPVVMQIEEPVVKSVSGREVTLTEPLRYDHLGGRDTDGKLIALGHVGNLTRTIVIRSENPSGTRGHTLFTERAKVDIRYAAFEQMGRTTTAPIVPWKHELHLDPNPIGRYPVHFHHLMGPVNPTNTGYQFAFVGNAVRDGRKWCIAIHNAHWGLVSDNVTYQCDGAAIMTEQGNERGNVIERNFAVKIGTMLNSPYNPIYGGVAGPGRPLGFGDHGWDGSAFWFSGNDNIVRDNVAANAAFAGLMYNSRGPGGFGFNHPTVPKFRGATIGVAAEWDNYRSPYRGAPPVIESARNEVYASTEGAWIAFSGEVGTIKDTLIWHARQKGVYAARNSSVTFDGLTIIGDLAASLRGYSSQNSSLTSIGLSTPGGIYTAGTVTVRRARVEGHQVGVQLPANANSIGGLWKVEPVTTIEGIKLRNFVNIVEYAPWGPKTTRMSNVDMQPMPGPANKWLSPTPMNIISAIDAPHLLPNISRLSRTFINDQEYFFPEQAPNHVARDCPLAGLTNRECWERYGVATLGRVATCADTRPEVRGFVCPPQP